MKTIFWNVDTQYDFMRDDESHKGALPIPDARSIEDKLSYVTNVAKENDMKVVSTADWHNEDSEEFSDNPDYVSTFPPHCLQETRGAEYVPATAPENAYTIDWQDNKFDTTQVKANRNIVLYKDAFDVFAGNKHTNAVVEQLAPERAIVYGVATNYCVNFAVQGLLDRGIEVLVVEDAIKEIPGDSYETTLQSWEERGVKHISTNELTDYLR